MGVLAQFPAKVISQPEVSPTLAREITTQDLQNMGEDLMGILTLLYENTSFAIVSGVNYLGGNNFSNGVIILNGIPYYFSGGALLNKYLIPDDDSVELSITGVYNDDNNYPIYRLYSLKINNTAISGSSPQFIDNMSQYKVNLNILKTALKSTTVNDISVVVTSSTTITGSQSDSTMVIGSISATSNNITYNYIMGNSNIVIFDVNIQGSPFIFNIKDKTGTLIETYSGSGSVKVQLLLINLGSGWVEITGFKSNIDTINSEIVTIGSQVSTLNTDVSTLISENPNGIKMKKIEINNWCMWSTDSSDFQNSQLYTHGLGANIVAVDIVICNDTGGDLQPITKGGSFYFDGTNIYLTINTNGYFDNNSHASAGTSAHRGWIIARSV